VSGFRVDAAVSGFRVDAAIASTHSTKLLRMRSSSMKPNERTSRIASLRPSSFPTTRQLSNAALRLT
jgi:hypothetical protein